MLVSSIAKRDFAAANEVIGGVVAPGGAGAPSLALGARCLAEPGVAAPVHAGPVSLESACPGREVEVATPEGGGKCWLVRRTLGEIAPGSEHIACEYAAVMRGARQRVDELEASAALCVVTASAPGDLLFMDIETCGLAGTAVFLVGTMFYEDEQLVFQQHLARDYSEEAAIVQAFYDRLPSAGVLVTFNGKAFDMNFLAERAAYHGIHMGASGGTGLLARGAQPGRALLPVHLDLLHESRRRWRKSLPNCRLQTLERNLCHRLRQGDIPGWAIPDAYHRFVGDGDAGRLADILHHNLLDMLTMAQLVCAVLTGAAPAME
jgi:uncharacterized protein YprB with RNaseH-like and TPR domain